MKQCDLGIKKVIVVIFKAKIVYIRLVRVKHCKVLANSHQLAAFPLEVDLGFKIPISEVEGKCDSR